MLKINLKLIVILFLLSSGTFLLYSETGGILKVDTFEDKNIENNFGKLWIPINDSQDMGDSTLNLKIKKNGADNSGVCMEFKYNLKKTVNWEWPYVVLTSKFSGNLDLSKYNGVEFYIKSSKPSDFLSIEINVYDEIAGKIKPMRYYVQVTNKFKKVMVPFDKLKIANWWELENKLHAKGSDFSKAIGISFVKNGSNGEKGIFYIDEIAFYKSGKNELRNQFSSPPDYFKINGQGMIVKKINAEIIVQTNQKYIDPYNGNNGKISTVFGSNWGNWLGEFPDTKKSKQLNFKIFRIGGNQISRFNWRNSSYTNTGGEQKMLSHQSVDEFIDFCNKIGAEPLIQVNAMGWAPDEKSGKFKKCMTAEDAAELVRYLNGKKKYNVKFFEIDNEPFIWHLTHKDVVKSPVSVDEYFEIFKDYSIAMKKAQAEISTANDIKIMGPAISTAWNDWKTLDKTEKYSGFENAIPYFLKKCRDFQNDRVNNPGGYKILDIFSFHLYPGFRKDYLNPESFISEGTEKMLESVQTWWNPVYRNKYDYSQPRGKVLMTIPKINQWINEYSPGIEVAITEMGVDAASQIKYDPIVKPLYFADLYGVIAKYGIDYALQFCLNSDDHGLALLNEYDEILPLYYPTMLYATHFKGEILQTKANKGDFLNIYACDDKNGNIVLMVVNKNSKKDYNTMVSLKGYTGNALSDTFNYVFKRYTLTCIKIPKNKGINEAEVWEYGAEQIY